MAVKRGRQCFREVSGERLGKIVVSSILVREPVINLAAHSHKACDASHQSQPGMHSIRHGEGNPIAADLVLCRDGDLDVALAESTCQVVTKLFEDVVASGLVDCTLDVECGEASGRSEFLFGN